MKTDGWRGCPTRRLANAVADRAPVWRYLYTHAYEDDPFSAQFRAGHVLEELLLWHSDVAGTGHVLTPAEEILSRQMTDYWTNFAKSGDPNAAGLPSWPSYDSVDEPILRLDDDVAPIAAYHRKQCAFLDSLPALFPAAWDPGIGPTFEPPGFAAGRARGFG